MTFKPFLVHKSVTLVTVIEISTQAHQGTVEKVARSLLPDQAFDRQRNYFTLHE